MSQIIWTEKAKFDYWNNIEYLQEKWTLADVHNFIDKVEDLLSLLTQENTTFKATAYKDTYIVPVTKQVSLFYKKGQNNNIELLRFWNNYQNPKKLTF